MATSVVKNGRPAPHRTFQIDAVGLRYPHEVHPALGLGLLEAAFRAFPHDFHTEEGAFNIKSSGGAERVRMRPRVYRLSAAAAAAVAAQPCCRS